MRPSSKRSRRGSALYITVLSTTLIVALLGLAGLTIVRIERLQTNISGDRRTARVNADSAVQLALRVIANDPNWRTTYTNGVETAPQSLHADATGTLSWILEDTDGSLADGDTILKLKGVGRAGDAVQVSSVQLAPNSVSVGPVTFKENTAQSNFEYVDQTKWWAQYVKPDLPADAIEWKVSSVEIMGGKSNVANETLLVKLYLPDTSNMPETQVDALQAAEAGFPSTADWLLFQFPGQPGLDPNLGVCVALECTTKKAAAFFHYLTSGDTDPNSELIRGSQASGWTTVEPGGALMFRLHGTYESATGGLHAVTSSWTHDSYP